MRVLITGTTSYVGLHFIRYCEEWYKDWIVESISVRDHKWRDLDFSVYDAIYHVAAIVHRKEKKGKSVESIYYKVNTDLTFELAKKAKDEGVKSFVFLSTIAVYGLNGSIGKDTVITKKTMENPVSLYGKSKLEGERKVINLRDDNFSIPIVRVPMIYGKDCPGNYTSLSRLVNKLGFFPDVNNRRSLIFIDDLSEIVNCLITNHANGLFLVQNKEYVNTKVMAKYIACSQNREIYFSEMLGKLTGKYGNKFAITRKVFGNLVYDKKDSTIANSENYKRTFEETIKLAEK